MKQLLQKFALQRQLLIPDGVCVFCNFGCCDEAIACQQGIEGFQRILIEA